MRNPYTSKCPPRRAEAEQRGGEQHPCCSKKSIMDYVNRIELQGTVISVRSDIRRTVVQLALSTGTERMFAGRDNTTVSYYPEIIFYTPNLGKRLITGKSHVEIVAHAHTYYNNVTKRNVNEIVGDSIKDTERFLARYINDIPEHGGRENDRNEALFVGPVYRIRKRSEGVVYLTLAIPDRNRKDNINYCSIVCMGNNKDERGGRLPFATIASSLKEGEWVAVGAQLSTMRDAEKGFRQSIVCRDIERVQQEEQ